MKKTKIILIRYSIRNHGKQLSTLTDLKQALQNARCRNRLWHCHPPYPGADDVQQPPFQQKIFKIPVERSISKVELFHTSSDVKNIPPIYALVSAYPEGKPRVWRTTKDSF